MEAGRELDALIAEKVMGWSSQADGLYWDAGNHRTRLVLGSIIAKKRDEMGLENAQGFVFAPSTNITDAWEVVERLVSTPGPNGDHHSVQVDYSGDAVVVIDENEDWQVSAIADTAPLAICLAALKAVSQEGQHGQ